MRILLDENLPESLLAGLRGLGHEADSVNSLRLKGLDNGTLYREVARDYDLCFTRDAAFVQSVQRLRKPRHVKLLRVTLPQTRASQFVRDFVEAFRKTDWSEYGSGADWP
ncbi:MAG: DUF5615 family PIN-like protein [Chloroflexi bacterium]|nr:DUF5615 family PIN-like protein [Chloroflexota bacterium]